MKYTKPEKLRMLRFLSDKRKQLWKRYSDHQQEEGYVVVRVSPAFDLVEEPYFVKRAFYKKDFRHLLDDKEPAGTGTDKDFLYYYEIWWGHNNHIWRIKEASPEV